MSGSVWWRLALLAVVGLALSAPSLAAASGSAAPLSTRRAVDADVEAQLQPLNELDEAEIEHELTHLGFDAEGASDAFLLEVSGRPRSQSQTAQPRPQHKAQPNKRHSQPQRKHQRKPQHKSQRKSHQKAHRQKPMTVKEKLWARQDKLKLEAKQQAAADQARKHKLNKQKAQQKAHQHKLQARKKRHAAEHAARLRAKSNKAKALAKAKAAKSRAAQQKARAAKHLQAKRDAKARKEAARKAHLANKMRVLRAKAAERRQSRAFQAARAKAKKQARKKALKNAKAKALKKALAPAKIPGPNYRRMAKLKAKAAKQQAIATKAVARLRKEANDKKRMLKQLAKQSMPWHEVKKREERRRMRKAMEKKALKWASMTPAKRARLRAKKDAKFKHQLAEKRQERSAQEKRLRAYLDTLRGDSKQTFVNDVVNEVMPIANPRLQYGGSTREIIEDRTNRARRGRSTH